MWLPASTHTRITRPVLGSTKRSFVGTQPGLRPVGLAVPAPPRPALLLRHDRGQRREPVQRALRRLAIDGVQPPAQLVGVDPVLGVVAAERLREALALGVGHEAGSTRTAVPYATTSVSCWPISELS